MWLLILQLFYVIPSVILYILTVWTVSIQWSTFKSSFFQFYIFDFVVNLFTLLNTFYILRLANYTCSSCLMAPIFSNLDNYFSSALFYALQYHMAYVQYSSTLASSLNRLTVIKDFIRFERLWRRFSIYVMALILLAPTANTIWIMSYKTEWTYQDREARFLLHSYLSQTAISVFLLPFMIISTLLSLILNLTSMALVRNVSQQRKKLVEIHFLKLILITCTVQLVGTILTMLLAVTPNPSIFFSTVVTAIPFVSDCLTLCHPWLLFWLSKPVRDNLWNALRPTPTSSSILVLQARQVPRL